MTITKTMTLTPTETSATTKISAMTKTSTTRPSASAIFKYSDRFVFVSEVSRKDRKYNQDRPRRLPNQEQLNLHT